MEGYVRLKTSFTTVKVWMVLEGQDLSYYDYLDLAEQAPKKLKGQMSVRDGKVKKFQDEKFPMGIKVKNSKGGGKLVFDCYVAASWNAWFNALNRAVKEHEEIAKKKALPAKYREVLEIDPSLEKLTKSIITRAYKKISLREHPDKGGNADNFSKITEAYSYLLSYQAEEDSRERSDVVQYEAIVEKVTGLGLGINLIEDRLRDAFLVTSVDENIVLHGLSAEAEGEILANDALVAVDLDDISNWHFSRLKARLDTNRVPYGGKVLLVFERRIDREEGNYSNTSYVSSPVSSPMPSAKHDEARQPNHHQRPFEDTFPPEGASAERPITPTAPYAEKNVSFPDTKEASSRNNNSTEEAPTTLNTTEKVVLMPNSEEKQQATVLTPIVPPTLSVPIIIMPATDTPTVTAALKSPKSASDTDANDDDVLILSASPSSSRKKRATSSTTVIISVDGTTQQQTPQQQAQPILFQEDNDLHSDIDDEEDYDEEEDADEEEEEGIAIQDEDRKSKIPASASDAADSAVPAISREDVLQVLQELEDTRVLNTHLTEQNRDLSNQREELSQALLMRDNTIRTQQQDLLEHQQRQESLQDENAALRALLLQQTATNTKHNQTSVLLQEHVLLLQQEVASLRAQLKTQTLEVQRLQEVERSHLFGISGTSGSASLSRQSSPYRSSNSNNGHSRSSSPVTKALNQSLRSQTASPRSNSNNIISGVGGGRVSHYNNGHQARQEQEGDDNNEDTAVNTTSNNPSPAIHRTASGVSGRLSRGGGAAEEKVDMDRKSSSSMRITSSVVYQQREERARILEIKLRDLLLSAPPH